MKEGASISLAERQSQTTATGALPHAACPILFTLSVILAGYIVLFIAALLQQVPIRLVDYRGFLGIDFADFHNAALDVIDGRNPYDRPRFVTPPLSSLLALPLANQAQPEAARVFMALNIVSIVAGVLLLARRFRLNRSTALLFFLTCGFSSSTLMLIERGNIDGFVFLVVCVAFAVGPSTPLAIGAIALASALKAYPAVFLVQLLVRGHWKSVAVAAAFFGLLPLIFMSGDYLDFAMQQVGRSTQTRFFENLSSMVLPWSLGQLLEGASSMLPLRAGVFLYGGLLCACLWFDYKFSPQLDRTHKDILLASYAVFCVNMPTLVYLYSGLILLILIAGMSQSHIIGSRKLRCTVGALVGFVMAPVSSLSLTLGHDWLPVSALPPVANLCLLISTLWVRVEIWRTLTVNSSSYLGGQHQSSLASRNL